MPKHPLTAVSPLGGYRESFDGVQAEERPDLAIISIAVPLGGRPALNDALAAAYGAALPAAGKVTQSRDGRTRFLGMASDQVFVLFDDPRPDAAAAVAATLGGAGYYTQQSDNWMKLRLSGPQARARLARLCPVDLDSAVLPADCLARTIVEHHGAVILVDGEESFLLLSPASWAETFRDAVRTGLGPAFPGPARATNR